MPSMSSAPGSTDDACIASISALPPEGATVMTPRSLKNPPSSRYWCEAIANRTDDGCP